MCLHDDIVMDSIGDRNFQLHYDFMGPPSQVQFVIDGNAVMYVVPYYAMEIIGGEKEDWIFWDNSERNSRLYAMTSFLTAL